MKKIDVTERNTLLKQPYREKIKSMDKINLAEYETVKSFQASWI